MKLEIDSEQITVRLSRRNLLALLHKLERPDSARTIDKIDEISDGTCIKWQAVAEEDAIHYANREPPGPMHPAEEKFLAQ